jgi:preprotein translocase subunit SecA
MFKKIFEFFFGSKYQRDMKKLMPYVTEINSFEETIEKLTDEELKSKTNEFKNRLEQGQTLDDIMCEAYAVVRETARRTLGERPFDEQLMGAITMHWGNIAEMKTGEGKTLAATMPLYLNSLTGKACHLITVNDYLAKRDAEWMGKIYEYLGVTVAALQQDNDKEERKKAYEADILYGTNSGFGFDYLRDNMVRDMSLKVQRGHYFAIIDEVDSILIDEARTPLIISGPAEGDNEIYRHINKAVKRLDAPTDWDIPREMKMADFHKLLRKVKDEDSKDFMRDVYTEKEEDPGVISLNLGLSKEDHEKIVEILKSINYWQIPKEVNMAQFTAPTASMLLQTGTANYEKYIRQFYDEAEEENEYLLKDFYKEEERNALIECLMEAGYWNDIINKLEEVQFKDLNLMVKDKNLDEDEIKIIGSSYVLNEKKKAITLKDNLRKDDKRKLINVLLKVNFIDIPRRLTRKQFNHIYDQVNDNMKEIMSYLYLPEKNKTFILKRELTKEEKDALIDFFREAEFTDGDYKVAEKEKSVTLTPNGINKVEKFLGIEDLYDARNIKVLHVINQCLRANYVYYKDVDYIVENGKVVIIDQFTGRKMPTRRFSDGLHSALESKEGVNLQRENQTLATITIQNYFRMYQKLAGMTGTAETEAEEFNRIYGLDVTVIPTHEPIARVDDGDRVYKNEKAKVKAVIEEIEARHKAGQPLLVGTISVEKSERLSKMLKSRKITHSVLNAKQHEKEANIIKNAGKRGAVTIATNMAGRGTDIKLDDESKEAGGLCVIGTERHESRRIDNQLRGRSGRQGDPGRSIFFLSFDDDLLRLFGSQRMQNMMSMFGIEEGQMITHKMITRMIENAQKKVEGRNYDIRKHLLEYDDVMNQQRSYVYEMRDAILLSDNLPAKVKDMTTELAKDIINDSVDGNSMNEEEVKDLLKWLKANFGFEAQFIKRESYDVRTITKLLEDEFNSLLESKTENIGEENFIQVEKIIMLRAIDAKWKSHLYNMDALRQGISWVSMAQRNPLTEYKREGMEMFSNMKYDYRKEVISTLLRINITRKSFQQPMEKEEEQSTQTKHQTSDRQFGGVLVTTQAEKNQDKAAGVRQQRRVYNKVGRNDPCPCGSGKKYKHCHGKNT